MEGPSSQRVLIQGEIWIVDDSAAMRGLLGRILQREFPGLVLREMGDGAEAWRNREGLTRADLVITDMDMPHMDGLTLLRKMQSDPHLRRIPSVLISGRESDNHQAPTKAFFLQKPFPLSDIVEVVRYLLSPDAPC